MGKRNRLFWGIFLSFFALVMLTFVAFAVFWNYYQVMIRNDFIQKSRQNMESSVGLVDMYLNSVLEINGGILNEQAIHDNLYPFSQISLSQYTELRRIVKTLSINKGKSAAIVDGVYLYADTQRVYNSSGVDFFDDFFNRFHAYENYPVEVWRSKLESDRLVEILAPALVEDKWANSSKEFVPILTVSVINGSKVVMVTDISVAATLAILRDNSLFDTSHFFVYDGDGVQLLSSLHEVPALDEEWLAIGQGEGFGAVELDGSPYIVNRVVSSIYGWRYYSLISEKEFDLYSTPLMHVLIIIIISLTAAGIIISLLFTKRIYSPLSEISRILFKSNLSSFRSTFKEITMGVSELAQQKDEFQSKYTRISIEYRDSMLRDILSGASAGMTEESEAIAAAELGFCNSIYVCCLVRFHFTSAFNTSFQDVDRHSILSYMGQVLRHLWEEAGICHVIEDPHHTYICIVNTQSGGKVLDSARSILQYFENDNKYCTLRISIGENCTSLKDLAQSYRDNCLALANADLAGGAQILLATFQRGIKAQLLSDLEKRRLRCLIKSGGDLREVELCISSYLNKAGSNRRQVVIITEQILQLAIRCAISEDDQNKRLIDSIDPILQQIQSDEEGANRAMEEIRNFIEPIVRVHNDGGQEYRIAAHVLEKIEENYRGDLFLENLAETAGVSSKSLSRIFKNCVGVYLPDYINEYRIRRAEYLICETSMTMMEVAANVGIHSKTTFFRLFKKYTDYTPMQYRSMRCPKTDHGLGEYKN